MFVTINTENLKNYIKQKVLNEVQARSSNWEHTNHDYKFRPSEWDVDPNGTIRHTLETGISTSISTDTLHILLTYKIIDISPK